MTNFLFINFSRFYLLRLISSSYKVGYVWTEVLLSVVFILRRIRPLERLKILSSFASGPIFWPQVLFPGQGSMWGSYLGVFRGPTWKCSGVLLGSMGVLLGAQGRFSVTVHYIDTDRSPRAVALC